VFLLAAVFSFPAIAQVGSNTDCYSLTAVESAICLAERGEASSQFGLALYYLTGRGVPEDHAVAAYWYLKAAEQGHVMAQYDLASLYERGDGVEQDLAIAAYWYHMAAEQDYKLAQYSLAEALFHGQGVAQDHTAAAQWYSKAAEQGHSESQYRLGHLYDVGGGVPQDYSKAFLWFRAAAEQGHVDAQAQLGAMYTLGDAIPENFVLAFMWSNLAAAQGSEVARDNKNLLREHMTSEQIAEAQQMSSDWMLNYEAKRLAVREEFRQRFEGILYPANPSNNSEDPVVSIPAQEDEAYQYPFAHLRPESDKGGYFGFIVLAGLGLVIMLASQKPSDVSASSEANDGKSDLPSDLTEKDEAEPPISESRPQLDPFWWIGGLAGITSWYSHSMLVRLNAGSDGTYELGELLGFGAPIFLGTGLVALIVQSVKKDTKITMWVWTILLAVVMAILSLGATRMVQG
jgi:TPR repeat protein